MGRAGAGGVVDTDNHKGRSFEALYEWEIDRIHVGAYDPVARLAMMDEAGVYAQVIFPNTVGLGGQGLSQAVPDPALRMLCVEMYNDANAEMQEESGNRLLPMAVLPAWDVDACVREAQRCAATGHPRREHHLGPAGPRRARPRQPRLGPAVGGVRRPPPAAALPHRWRASPTMSFFEQLPVAVARRRHQARDRRHAAVHREQSRASSTSSARACSSGYPELKIVSVESGAGWVPFILEALDYEMAENAPKLRNETLSMSPSEYFKRQIYATHVVRAHRPPVARRRPSARTTSCSRPTSRTRRASTPTRSRPRARTCASSPRRSATRSSAATPRSSTASDATRRRSLTGARCQRA